MPFAPEARSQQVAGLSISARRKAPIGDESTPNSPWPRLVLARLLFFMKYTDALRLVWSCPIRSPYDDIDPEALLAKIVARMWL